MFDGYLLKPVTDHLQNGSLSSVVTLTPPSESAQVLAIQALTKSIRYTVTIGGSSPSASSGFQITAGGSDIIPVASGAVVKVIEESASASIEYQWYDIVGVI